MIMSHYFMIWPILEARAEIQKYFRSFLVQMKTLKFASEVYWPLKSKYNEMYIHKMMDPFTSFFVCDVVMPWIASNDARKTKWN